MRFTVSDRDNSFVRAVGYLAQNPRVTDEDLGFAYWQVLSYQLFKYIPKHLEESFYHCYSLASEFEWRHETFFLKDVLAETVRLPNGLGVSFEDALQRISPNLVSALTLPTGKAEWQPKAFVLLCAACELSQHVVSKEAPFLTRCFIGANPVFSSIISM